MQVPESFWRNGFTTADLERLVATVPTKHRQLVAKRVNAALKELNRVHDPTNNPFERFRDSVINAVLSVPSGEIPEIVVHESTAEDGGLAFVLPCVVGGVEWQIQAGEATKCPNCGRLLYMHWHVVLLDVTPAAEGDDRVVSEAVRRYDGEPM